MTREEMKQTLCAIDFFELMTQEELNKALSTVKLKECTKGDVVYNQGDKLEYVYFLEKGHVKLAYQSGIDKVLIKNIAYDHEMFGENIFTAADSRNEFVECMSECTIYMLPVDLFKDLVLSSPALSDHVIKTIMYRLQNLEDRVHNFVFKKAKRRIIDFIKKSGDLRGIKIGIDECLINHGMSHKEIAFLTDTSRQTVARVLGELKRDNLIFFSARKPGKILIKNLV